MYREKFYEKEDYKFLSLDDTEIKKAILKLRLTSKKSDDILTRYAAQRGCISMPFGVSP